MPKQSLFGAADVNLGDADAPARGRFGTNRLTMLCFGDDALGTTLGGREA